MDDVWFQAACRAPGVWMNRHVVAVGTPGCTSDPVTQQRRAHPLCSAIAVRDLRKEELSTISTDAMTTTNL